MKHVCPCETLIIKGFKKYIYFFSRYIKCTSIKTLLSGGPNAMDFYFEELSLALLVFLFYFTFLLVLQFSDKLSFTSWLSPLVLTL